MNFELTEEEIAAIVKARALVARTAPAVQQAAQQQSISLEHLGAIISAAIQQGIQTGVQEAMRAGPIFAQQLLQFQNSPMADSANLGQLRAPAPLRALSQIETPATPPELVSAPSPTLAALPIVTGAAAQGRKQRMSSPAPFVPVTPGSLSEQARFIVANIRPDARQLLLALCKAGNNSTRREVEILFGGRVDWLILMMNINHQYRRAAVAPNKVLIRSFTSPEDASPENAFLDVISFDNDLLEEIGKELSALSGQAIKMGPAKALRPESAVLAEDDAAGPVSQPASQPTSAPSNATATSAPASIAAPAALSVAVAATVKPVAAKPPAPPPVKPPKNAPAKGSVKLDPKVASTPVPTVADAPAPAAIAPIKVPGKPAVKKASATSSPKPPPATVSKPAQIPLTPQAASAPMQNSLIVTQAPQPSRPPSLIKEESLFDLPELEVETLPAAGSRWNWPS